MNKKNIDNIIENFQKINQIPRGSGNEEAISNYLFGWATNLGLEVKQDNSNNLLITSKATKGYEDKEGIIIQGHMDMVCDKTADSDHDFLKDPIKLVKKGDIICADKTTLGADNGIAVAMGMTLLEDLELQHPMIEFLITTDEEVGMTGAISFDKRLIKGKYFINLDSEEEGEFTVGCAGGLKGKVHIPLEYQKVKEGYKRIDVEISKLLGGHSGVEIDKCRANAIKIAGRILHLLNKNIDVGLIRISGGTRDNVICHDLTMSLAVNVKQINIYNEIMDDISTKISKEYVISDPDISISSEVFEGEYTEDVIKKDVFESLVFILMTVPNGIQSMSANLKGFVESSLNVGKVAFEDEYIELLYAVRSSVSSLKDNISDVIETIVEKAGAKYYRKSEYPAWPVKNSSYLLDKSIEVFEDKFKEKPIVKSIHAGLEAGVFLEGCQKLEAISIGPNMSDVHSPKENFSISSVDRTYEFLKDLIIKL